MPTPQLEKLLLFLFLLPGPLLCSQQNQADRPNIIFLLTDDQRWDALGYAGNEIIQTPEMDKLAQEGIYFKNAFVTTPICAASRASIITGQYERRHGYTFGQPPMSKAQIDESYFVKLKEAGYYNGFLGKLGLRFKNQMDKELFKVYQPEGAGFYFRLKDNTHIHLTDLMGQRAVNFIKEAPTNRPFCLSVSYNAPHAEDRSPFQYIWPRDLDTLYENIEIPGPVMADDPYFDSQPDFVKEGFNRVRWYWRFDTPQKYQHSLKGYYRMISGIDRTIGWMRKALEEKGVADNTIIILLGDNGYFLGERQFAGKWLMYENSLRVPLIIYDPRQKQHREIEDFGLNIDIAPTLLDYAGIPIPEGMQGISLKGYAEGKNPGKDREAFLCEHLWDFDPIAPSEGIRTKKEKYFRYIEHPDYEELYLLNKDPQERENLVEKKRYSKLKDQLKKQLEELINTLK